ncbi:MAG: peptidoglycan-associated lipoprotein Pal [Alphaproteobacteria bacterium]|nr:peptidoglycan-associated lipoprotein Pal [Alphaproteobacteria bacterium]MCB9696066.1 peptidoglycan-associated lipoprotein Pal [Alphaproteobacteria bacterium]
MNRTIATLVLVASLVVSGCKKKPPEPVAAPAPAPTMAAPAPVAAAVPEHVQQLRDNFQKVYFDTDSSDLNADSKAVLDANAEILQKHVDVRVQITGHADERGTSDYNLALGDRRAEIVKKYLMTQGVSADRLTVLSFGEERPEATGHDESAWSKNRRAEFVISWENASGAVRPQ